MSRLSRELSGAPVGTDESSRPVCKRCHDLGASSEDLRIGTGEPVYVCLYWEEWSGWRVLGVYHADHVEAIGSVLESPQKPVAVFEAEYEERPRDGTDSTGHPTYVLTDVSCLDLTFPEGMVSPDEITM